MLPPLKVGPFIEMNMLPYGHSELTVHLPDSFQVDWIEPPYVPPAADPLEVVREAIANPVDRIPLQTYADAKSVAIAINDKTRPVPHEFLLPPLLEALESMGIRREAVKLMIATGTHLPMQADEFQRILPDEILSKYGVISHQIDDPSNYVSLGRTSYGTPVNINRTFYESDLKIVVGNIEPHHFAGFSGGYKTAAIGLGSRETINPNHAMLVDEHATIGEYDQNPLRQDIEEMGDQIGVQFALNAILNGEKKIVWAVSGSPRAVMKAGIPLSREICQTQNSQAGSYDLVIASAGGSPKDINFYQAQKALTHAALFVRPGGVILLAAECPEGSGNKAYEQFMDGLTSFQEVYTRFREMGFKVGPHKAFQVARIAGKARIVLLSQMSASLVKKLLMTPAANLPEAIASAQALLVKQPGQPIRTAVLPRATNTIPVSG